MVRSNNNNVLYTIGMYYREKRGHEICSRQLGTPPVSIQSSRSHIQARSYLDVWNMTEFECDKASASSQLQNCTLASCLNEELSLLVIALIFHHKMAPMIVND